MQDSLSTPYLRREHGSAVWGCLPGQRSRPLPGWLLPCLLFSCNSLADTHQRRSMFLVPPFLRIGSVGGIEHEVARSVWGLYSPTGASDRQRPKAGAPAYTPAGGAKGETPEQQGGATATLAIRSCKSTLFSLFEPTLQWDLSQAQQVHVHATLHSKGTQRFNTPSWIDGSFHPPIHSLFTLPSLHNMLHLEVELFTSSVS